MEKDMPCEICGKLVSLIKRLIENLFLISPYSALKFATTKHLTRHRMYHEDPKYKCQFEGCLKAFIDNAKLKDHMKLHEGNRDHVSNQNVLKFCVVEVLSLEFCTIPLFR